ncbi:AAEL009953-PA [Aedes aegypti]|uniref:AAEL009953-PA n=1 Tax=Aedes aegypti TaxID=7159 RepID=Q16UB9_AEDAE|nr:AAEL009953-PA [Aedes aegypti]
MVKIILLVAALCATALGIDVHSCGDDYPHPTQVIVPGCNVMPCEVPNLSDFSFSVRFAPSFPTGTLAVDVSATLGDFNLPYETPDHLRDGCANIDGSCPLAAGQEVTLSGTAPVEAPLTRVTVRLRFEITGDGGQKAVCFAADMVMAVYP